MTIPWSSIRLLRITIHMWLVGYLLSSLPAAEWLWVYPVSPPLPGPPGPFRFLTHGFQTWLPPALALPSVFALVLLAVYPLIRRSRWWISFVIWSLFTSLMNHAWLAASGGHQLIANVLFWLIFVPHREDPLGFSLGWRSQLKQVAGSIAFWIIRLQLLLAYAVTGVQKLTGEYWLGGQAVGIVSTDPDYGPAFLSDMPQLSMALTYATLLFQLLFPLAVWWRPTRWSWMALGVVFHLSTGVSFGILDMGLAFIACYPVWFTDTASKAWLSIAKRTQPV